MSKAKKDGTKRTKGAKAKTGKAAKAEKNETPAVDLEPLRKPIEEAKAALDAAEAEARETTEKARARVAEAKETFRNAVAPFREACRKAGVECEYEGGRGANVSEKVTFVVEKTEKGVRVAVKGRPETEKVIPLAALKESINKCAYTYTDETLGPREKVGNKGGSLSNRLRAVLR